MTGRRWASPLWPLGNWAAWEASTECLDKSKQKPLKEKPTIWESVFRAFAISSFRSHILIKARYLEAKQLRHVRQPGPWRPAPRVLAAHAVL